MSSHRHQGSPSFLGRTFAVLSDSSLQDTVAWSEDGRSFEVRDVGKFITTVLPRVAQCASFAGFVRKLDVYKFHKEPGANVFSHPLFVRGAKGNIRKIKRKGSKPLPLNTELDCILQLIQALQRSTAQLEVHISHLQDQSTTIEQDYQALQTQTGQFKAICSNVDLALSHFADYSKPKSLPSKTD